MSLNLQGKRVAVIGSRTFDDKEKLYDVLTKNLDRIKVIVSGGAKGADSLAVEWASDFGIPYLVFPAMWRDPFTGAYYRGAGFKRNRYIIEHCDTVIAFWDGESQGTLHSIHMAEEMKKPIKIVDFKVKVSAADLIAQPTPVAHIAVDLRGTPTAVPTLEVGIPAPVISGVDFNTL
jgi:hypothetical protein